MSGVLGHTGGSCVSCSLQVVVVWLWYVSVGGTLTVIHIYKYTNTNTYIYIYIWIYIYIYISPGILKESVAKEFMFFSNSGSYAISMM